MTSVVHIKHLDEGFVIIDERPAREYGSYDRKTGERDFQIVSKIHYIGTDAKRSSDPADATVYPTFEKAVMAYKGTVGKVVEVTNLNRQLLYEAVGNTLTIINVPIIVSPFRSTIFTSKAEALKYNVLLAAKRVDSLKEELAAAERALDQADELEFKEGLDGRRF